MLYLYTQTLLLHSLFISNYRKLEGIVDIFNLLLISTLLPSTQCLHLEGWPATNRPPYSLAFSWAQLGETRETETEGDLSLQNHCACS